MDARRAVTVARWVVPVVVVTLAVLLLAVEGLDPSRALDLFTGSSPLPIAAAAVVFVLTRGVRAWRWRFLFSAEGERPRVGRLFSVIMASEAISFPVPARAGDVARVYLLGRGRGYTRTGVSVVLEKLVDVAALGVVAAYALGAMPTAGGSAGGSSAAGVLRGSLAGVAVLAALVVLTRTRALEWLGGRLDRAGGMGIAERILREVRSGLTVLRAGRHLWAVLGGTVVLWLLNVAGIALVLMGVGLALPIAASFSVLMMQIVGGVLPSAPGRFATHQALTVVGLKLYGVPADPALAAAMWLYGCAIVFPAILAAPFSVFELRPGSGKRAGEVGIAVDRSAPAPETPDAASRTVETSREPRAGVTGRRPS